MQLRDYQREFVDACFDKWERHQSLLGVLPTGTGKTVCFAEIANHWQDGRVLVICPQIELVEQAAKKLWQVTGEQPGIEQGQRASNESKWARSQFVVASKQTLSVNKRFTDRYGVKQRQKRYERIKDVGLVIVDEAHYAATEAFAEILDHYKSRDAKVLGVTATPLRHDGKALGQLFEECAYQMGIAEAVHRGWLVAPRTHCVEVQSLDLSNVRTTSSTGDLNQQELEAALVDDEVVNEIAAITAAESGNMKTVVYCGFVREAAAVAGILADRYGIKAAYVCGDKNICSDSRRESILKSFANEPDGIQIICNVGVLTTGWDAPCLEHIVMARFTKSLPLYTQILGRGTRPLPGVVDFEGSDPESRKAAIAASAKPDFLVTDLRDNSNTHRLVTPVDVLAGEMGLVESKIAHDLMNKAATPQSVFSVIAAAKEEAEREEQRRQQEEARRRERKREAEERRRLAQQEAQAKYSKREVNIFDPYSVQPASQPKGGGPRVPFGKFKGKPVAALPNWYLHWMVDQDFVWKRYPWVAKAAAAQIGQSPDMPAHQPAAVEDVNRLLWEA